MDNEGKELVAPCRVLTPRKRRFVGALISARTVREAAGVAGVSERTGQRWLGDPLVLEAVRDAQAVALRDLARRGYGVLSLALDTLADVMQETCTKPTVRVSAARAALSGVVGLVELADLTERVEALESIGKERL